MRCTIKVSDYGAALLLFEVPTSILCITLSSQIGLIN